MNTPEHIKYGLEGELQSREGLIFELGDAMLELDEDPSDSMGYVKETVRSIADEMGVELDPDSSIKDDGKELSRILGEEIDVIIGAQKALGV